MEVMVLISGAFVHVWFGWWGFISKIGKVHFDFHHIYSSRWEPKLHAHDNLYIHVTVHRNKFFFNNQTDALFIQIYSVIKLYMFRASSLPIISSFLLYIRHW
jgi:hypothetical protein